MIIVICLVVGVLLPIFCHKEYEDAPCGTARETFALIGAMVGWFTSLVAVAMVIAAIVVHLCSPGFVAASQQRYESLVHQAESGMYDNDNDIGKKELANQIQEWNEDLAKGKTYQRNVWVGVFYPNVYDEFEYIPVELLE